MSDRTWHYIGVERALSDPQKLALLNRWYEMNPHQRGAQVADVLDWLDSHDAHLEVTEPLYEAHGDDPLVQARPIGLLTLCALAVIYVYGETEQGQCLRCNGAGKFDASALSLGQDPCGRCGGSGTAERAVARWELVERLLRRVMLPGDEVRLAGAAGYPDPEEPDVRTPVHAFAVDADGWTADTSLCGRLRLDDSDADPDDLIGYEAAHLDARCAWCDSRLSDLRAMGAKVLAP